MEIGGSLKCWPCSGFCLPAFQFSRSQGPPAICHALGLCVHLTIPHYPGLDIWGTLLLDLVLLTWSHQPSATNHQSNTMS